MQRASGDGDYDVESEYPARFFCPLTLDVMHSPVTLKTAPDATYEREALELWLEMHPRRDPLTNRDYEHALEYEANGRMRETIAAWRRERGLAAPRRPVLHRRTAVKALIGELAGDHVEEAAIHLAKLCEEDDSERVEARKRGAVEALLYLLRRAFSDKVKTASAKALAELARNGDIRHVIAAQGGVTLLVNLLAKQECQEAAAVALWRMARIKKIWIDEAVAPLVTLLTTGTPPRARLAASRAIWTLTVTEAHKHTIVKAGAVPKFARLLDDPDTAQVSSWALFNLAASHNRGLRGCVARHIGFHFFSPSLPALRKHLDHRALRAAASANDHRDFARTRRHVPTHQHRRALDDSDHARRTSASRRSAAFANAGDGTSSLR